ncbi:MAG: translocation/assembly module TamB domain-containing protein [Deltaproteobacteria bacterium]|jgi:autotransporter translocation and assembly factor TamB|nr:translocation/assembly module TamB domain-containing protein [Deltaproteobacteria bacterium]
MASTPAKDMPTPEASPSGRRRRPLRRRLLRAFLALTVLLAVAAAGTAALLRTQKGLGIAVDLARKALAAKGITLSAASIRGPLPESLRAEGVALADKDGVFLTAARVEAKLALRPLLSRRLEVELLSAEGVDLVRPPKLAPQPEDDPPGGPLSFPPVDVSAKVEIRDARILSGLDPALARGKLDLSAAITLLRDGRRIRWDAAGGWTGPDGKGVAFKTAHDPDKSPAEPLFLDLRADAGPGSPLAAFAEGLPFADPVLTVTGHGQPGGWAGDFVLTASAPPRASGEPAASPEGVRGPPESPAPVGSLSAAGAPAPAETGGPAPLPSADGAGPGGRPLLAGRLVFRGLSGNNAQEIVAALAGPFTIGLTAEKDPDFPVPEGFDLFLGRSLRLTSSFDKGDGDLSGGLKLQSEKGSLDLKPLLVAYMNDELRVEGQGSLEIMDFSEFSANVSAQAPDSQKSRDGEGSNESREGKDGTAPAYGESPALPAAGTAPPAQAAGFSPPARAAGAAAIPALTPGTAGQEAGPGQEEILPPPRVTAALAYSLKVNGGDVDVQGFTAAGDGLDLKVSGGLFRIPAGASGDPERADSGEGSRGGPGPEAKGKVALALEPGSGFARLVSRLLPALTSGAGIELSAEGGFLVGDMALRDVSVSARTGDLAAFLPVLGGDADLTLKATGALSGIIAAELDLKGERILIASGRGDPAPMALEKPALSVAGTLTDLTGGPSFDGRIDLSAKGRVPGDRTLRDASLSGAVAFATGTGGLSFSAKDLALSALGSELKAPALSARIPGQGPPELSGSLSLAVGSWELPAKLAGRGITGAPLYLELALDGGLDPPRYSATLKNQGLKIEGAATLASTELSLEASGSLTSPKFDLTLKEGPGEAGGIGWASGLVTAKSRAAGAPVDLTVSFKDKGGRDLVSLAGAYNAAGALARLDSLRLNWPGAKETLVLRRPASLSASGGNSFDAPRLSLDGLELSLGKASVSLKGDIRPVNLSLDVRDAPFSLSKDFQGPELPEGALASLTARLGPGGSGSFDLKAFTLLAGEAGGKLRFSAEAKGALEGGRALAGEIILSLPERPRRGARGRPAGSRQGAPVRAAGAGRGTGDVRPQAVPASARQGPEAVPGGGAETGSAASPGAPSPGAAASPPLGAGDPSLNAPDPDPVRVRYRLPFRQQGGFPVPDLAAPLEADVKWTGRVESVWGFFGLADRFLTGGIDLDARLRGTAGALNIGGTVYLAGGYYEDLASGVYLTGINLEGHVSDNSNNVSVVLEASDGAKGTIALEGALSLDGTPSLEARGQLRHLSPLHRDDVSLTVSGLARISGPLSALNIGVKAIVEALEVSLNQTGGGKSVRTLEIDTGLQKRSYGPALDVSVEIPRGAAYVRGRGLDSEWQGNIQVGGTASVPLFSGNLSPVRGYFTFLGKDFTFSGGGISFRNNRRFNPGLDIELTRSVPDLTAYLRVRGTLNRPRISFDSSPPYPQDEVLSQVLFGKESSQLSRLEALQLANSLMELTGVGRGMPNPLVSMRDVLGLSVLRLGETSSRSDDRRLEGTDFRDNLGLDEDQPSSADGGATLEAGKYLSDNIYVGVEQNLADNTTGVRVEVELTPHISLTSRTTPSSSRIALGWKRDY